jgi:hypothetical protein
MAPIFDLARDSLVTLKNAAIGVGEALWKIAKSLYSMAPIKKFFDKVGLQFKKIIILPFQKIFKSLKGLTALFKIKNWLYQAGKEWVYQKKREAKEKIIGWVKDKKDRAKYWLQMKLEAAKFWLWQKTKGIGKWLTKPFAKISRSALGGMWNAMKWMMPFFIGAIAGLMGSFMTMLAPLLLPVAIGLLALGAGALIQNLIKDPEFQKDWEIFTDWVVEKFRNLFDLVLKTIKDKALEYGLDIASFGLATPARRAMEKRLKDIEEEEKKRRKPIEEEEHRRIREDPEYRKKILEKMKQKRGMGTEGVGTKGVGTGPAGPAGTTGARGKLNVAERLNNPGNIKDQGTDFTDYLKQKYGATNSGVKAADGGTFLQFPTPEAGFAAMKEALKTKSGSKTVDERLKQWSGGGYGGGVAPHLSNRKVADLSDSEINDLAKRMMKQEGFRGQIAGAQTGGKITGGQTIPGKGIDNRLIAASVGEWVTPKGTAGLLNSILPGGMAALLRDPIGTLMKFASNFTFGGLGAGALMGFQRGGRVPLTRGELGAPIRGEIGNGLRNLESQEMLLNKLSASLTTGGLQQQGPVPIPVGMNSNTFNTAPIQVNKNELGPGGAPGDPLPTLMSTPVAWYIVLQNTV